MNIFEKYQQGGYCGYMHGQKPQTKIPGRIQCVYATDLTPVGYEVQWTGVARWPERYLEPADYGLYAKHGSGICLKTDALVFIDIDLEDKKLAGEAASLAWDMLGHGMVRTRDNSNRVGIVYRPAAAMGCSIIRFRRKYEGGKAAINEAVEILTGHGRQFVIEGIHKSGVPYVVQNWMPYKKLPEVSEATLGPFVQALKDLIPLDYEVQPHPQEGRTLHSQQNSNVVDLYEDHEIFTENGPTTVGSIVSDAKSFHLMHCQDPMEPDYGDGNERIAIIYTDGNPIISSFAHGGITYHLHAKLFNLKEKS